MTKEQHINYWIDTAQYDWTGTEHAFKAKDYMHCLFWAHLTLEKLAKAHWVKSNEENIPPKIHNVVWLLGQSNIDLGEETMKFLEDFNKFQLSGRYPDYTNNLYKMCTKEFTLKQLEIAKEVRICLLKMLQ
ncbi:MAG: HEPN domain-containing protein [Lentimicrobiaceae bacterium]|nr:HEPN domain-containing protein [Lentimicrobiaceae bacterium]